MGLPSAASVRPAWQQVSCRIAEAGRVTRLAIIVVLGSCIFSGEALGPLMRRTPEPSAESLLERRSGFEGSLETSRTEEGYEKAESAAMSLLLRQYRSYVMMARLSMEDALQLMNSRPVNSAQLIMKHPKAKHPASPAMSSLQRLQLAHTQANSAKATKASSDLPRANAKLFSSHSDKKKRRKMDRVAREKENLLSLLEWLSIRICSRECNCTEAKPVDCPKKIEPCRDACQLRIRKLHQASTLVVPGHEEYIEFPIISELQVPSPKKPEKKLSLMAQQTKQRYENRKRYRRYRLSRHARMTTTAAPTTTRTPDPTQTLPFIKPGSELERWTAEQLNTTNSSELRLRVSNDRTRYNGMLFAGGVMVNDSASFTARLCTWKCRVGEPYYDSTVIIGQLNQRKPIDAVAGTPGGNWTWTNAYEHWIRHIDEGAFVGPEDPRMDVLAGKRFLTVTMNIDGKEVGCQSSDTAFQYRHMHFIPVDHIPDAQPCRIRVDSLNQCMVQKNWASLVPRNSTQVLYIYSVRPLQVMYFDHTTCQATWTQRRGDGEAPKHLFGGVSFDPQYSVHGGTRYIFGKEVDAGDLYWSIGHTPSPDYLPVIIMVLLRKGQPEGPPKLELVGVSCPVDLSTTYGGSSKLKDGRKDWFDRMLITTSVVNFDPQADLAHITFQAQDRDNYFAELYGVGQWMQHVYKEFASSNLVFSCDMLH